MHVLVHNLTPNYSHFYDNVIKLAHLMVLTGIYFPLLPKPESNPGVGTTLINLR